MKEKKKERTRIKRESGYVTSPILSPLHVHRQASGISSSSFFFFFQSPHHHHESERREHLWCENLQRMKKALYTSMFYYPHFIFSPRGFSHESLSRCNRSWSTHISDQTYILSRSPFFDMHVFVVAVVVTAAASSSPPLNNKRMRVMCLRREREKKCFSGVRNTKIDLTSWSLWHLFALSSPQNCVDVDAKSKRRSARSGGWVADVLGCAA